MNPLTKVKMTFEQPDGTSDMCFAKFPEFLSVVEHSSLHFGSAAAVGPGRAKEVVRKIFRSFETQVMLGDQAEKLLTEISEGHIIGKKIIRLQDAKKLLITFSANLEPTLTEVREAMKLVSIKVGKDSHVFYNWIKDENCPEGVLKAFIIASDI
jgi:cell division GTPase FtsZ